MRHSRTEAILGGKTCTLHIEDNAKVLLLQPVDGHDREELEQQIKYIEEHTKIPFIHVAIHISKWNDELTPWPASPVFGKIPFGEGAHDTLLYIKEQLLAELYAQFCLAENDITVFLGGYSLAGLFSLWAAYQPLSLFGGIVAASPSAWYTGWLTYAESHIPQVKHAYLSLGDKEEKTKTKIMSTISKDILQQEELLKQRNINCKMEWNEGNHFQDNGIRTAKGFVWLIDNAL